MCGIAGIIDFTGNKVGENSLRAMMLAMKHRGPDDEGLFVDDNIGLGFVRLSILDLSMAGHQPMFSSDMRYCIIFNGEVYNYLELKEELKDQYSFKSNTDTEVVLYSFLKWGDNCLDRLNGMFAFVVYDTLTKCIFGARDRFGIKPFYYYQGEEKFVLASDIHSILSVLEKKPQPDDAVILNYLLLNRTNYSENTFFKEVKKIKPGHWIKIQNKEIIHHRWYDVQKRIDGKGFDSGADYYDLMKDSINLQLRSDVPVGICLSGGLDSSAIASTVLKEHSHSKFHSYSAIYGDGERGDEQEYINEFAATSMIMHYTKPTSDQLLEDLSRYITALGEPVPGTSEYAEFKVMELAQKHSTVVLNGQGADEVLAGYDYFYAAYLKELLINNKFCTFLHEIYCLLKAGMCKRSLKYLLFFMAPLNLKTIIFKKGAPYIRKDFYKKVVSSSKRVVSDFYEFRSLREFSIKHLEHKFEHHLLWADKSGMYFSIESRFPFIDHRLIENTLECDPNQLLNDGWTKSILREGFTDILPEKIRSRRSKIGFETPEDEWLRTKEFEDLISQIINSQSFMNRKYFNHIKVQKLYSEHLKRKKNSALAIWKIIHLELWLRKYID